MQNKNKHVHAEITMLQTCDKKYLSAVLRGPNYSPEVNSLTPTTFYI